MCGLSKSVVEAVKVGSQAIPCQVHWSVFVLYLGSSNLSSGSWEVSSYVPLGFG